MTKVDELIDAFKTVAKTKLDIIKDSIKLINTIKKNIDGGSVIIETREGLMGRKWNDVYIENVMFDRNDTYFEKSLGLTDGVVEVIRNVDFREVNIYISDQGELVQLGELKSRGLAKGEYNFTYAKFK